MVNTHQSQTVHIQLPVSGGVVGKGLLDQTHPRLHNADHPSLCRYVCALRRAILSARGFAQLPLYTFCSARTIPQLPPITQKTPHATSSRPAGLRQKLRYARNPHLSSAEVMINYVSSPCCLLLFYAV